MTCFPTGQQVLMFNLKLTVCFVCQSCATVSGLNQDGGTQIKDEFRKQMESNGITGNYRVSLYVYKR